MTKPACRFADLCTLLRETPRAILPRGVGSAQADRLLEAALRAPASALSRPDGLDGALKVAAGSDQIPDGYRHMRLADVNFTDLRLFVSRARTRLASLDRELTALAEQRAMLNDLLTLKG